MDPAGNKENIGPNGARGGGAPNRKPPVLGTHNPPARPLYL